MQRAGSRTGDESPEEQEGLGSHPNLLAGHRAASCLDDLQPPKLLMNLWPSEIQARFVSQIQIGQIRNDSLSIITGSNSQTKNPDFDEVPNEPKDFTSIQVPKEIRPEEFIKDFQLQRGISLDMNSSFKHHFDTSSRYSKKEGSPLLRLQPKPEIWLPAIDRASLFEDDLALEPSTPSPKAWKQEFTLWKDWLQPQPCRNYDIDVIPAIIDTPEAGSPATEALFQNMKNQDTSTSLLPPVVTQSSPSTTKILKPVGLKISSMEPIMVKNKKILKARVRSESENSTPRKRVTFSPQAFIRFIPKVKISPVEQPGTPRHRLSSANFW